MFKKIMLAGLIAAASAAASAGVIVSASSAVINSGAPGFGSIADTHNQNGLFVDYISGVTDFDAYISTDPLHTFVFTSSEWFSDTPRTSASVTYNLGAERRIAALALWNEEFAGASGFNLLSSRNGINFSLVASALQPSDNPEDTKYGPDVFSFSAVNAQFLRLDLYGCPQGGQNTTWCAIGEVAFHAVQAPVNAVPEPASLGLLGLGLAGLAALRRRR